MGRQLQLAVSPRVLNHAWRNVRNERGLWKPGLAVPEVERDLLAHVGELAAELLAGHYRPLPMRCFEIDKGNGDKRLISASFVRDKLVQRALLAVLEPLGEAHFHPASFGYRPQRTLDMVLAQVRERVRQGWVWLGDADIRACFDRVPQQPVLKGLRRLAGDRELVRVVGAGLDSMPARFRPVGNGRGLPQGMVLSPFLCNLHLHGLDQALERHAIPFVRFADDFLLFARSEADATRALEVAGAQLRKLGLELHPDKTRVIRSDRRHRFLGKRLPDGKPRFRP